MGCAYAQTILPLISAIGRQRTVKTRRIRRSGCSLDARYRFLHRRRFEDLTLWRGASGVCVVRHDPGEHVLRLEHLALTLQGKSPIWSFRNRTAVVRWVQQASAACDCAKGQNGAIQPFRPCKVPSRRDHHFQHASYDPR